MNGAGAAAVDSFQCAETGIQAGEVNAGGGTNAKKKGRECGPSLVTRQRVSVLARAADDRQVFFGDRRMAGPHRAAAAESRREDQGTVVDLLVRTLRGRIGERRGDHATDNTDRLDELAGDRSGGRQASSGIGRRRRASVAV